MAFGQNNSQVSVEDRVRGAIWGELVGDAYCLGSHWIYSLNELDKCFPDGIKGFDQPHPEHYHSSKKSGDFTHYGDAALVMLSSVANLGRFDVHDFGSKFIRLMGDEEYLGYRDHSTKGTLANYFSHLENKPQEQFDYQQGADDDQPAAVTRLAPVVVAHYDTKDFLSIVAQATRVCQNNSRAIMYAQAFALILRELLAGNSPEKAVSDIRQHIMTLDKSWAEINKRMKVACSARVLAPVDATMLFGQSCPLYSSFTSALQTTLVCHHDFSIAIQSTAKAGGDNAGRASMIGAWLGAHLGVNAIPESWRSSLSEHDAIESFIEKIVASRF